MKKTLLFSLLLMGLSCSFLFASPYDTISKEAKAAFQQKFPTARFTKWEEIKNSNLYAVRFVFENESLMAYLDSDGIFIATARYVSQENLPYLVSRTLGKIAHDLAISQVEELTLLGELSYIVTANSKHKKVTLQIYPNGNYQCLYPNNITR